MPKAPTQLELEAEFARERAAERAVQATGERPQPGTAKRAGARAPQPDPDASLRVPPIAIGGTGLFGSFWSVIAVAILIAGVAIATAHSSPGILLGLLGLILLGAIWPPLALGIGAVVLLRLLLVHTPELSRQLDRTLAAAPAPAPPSERFGGPRA